MVNENEWVLRDGKYCFTHSRPFFGFSLFVFMVFNDGEKESVRERKRKKYKENRKMSTQTARTN
jgi:hypothetical protein